jgi:serine/threonine protein kinase
VFVLFAATIFALLVPPGSYRYMAPEVFRHEPYNSRVDVYSFSMIVYQLFEVGWG